MRNEDFEVWWVKCAWFCWRRLMDIEIFSQMLTECPFLGPKIFKFSQKSKSSWNGSSEELFEVWVVGSTQIFSANLAVILVFSQTLINDELWRPDLSTKSYICCSLLIVFSHDTEVTQESRKGGYHDLKQQTDGLLIWGPTDRQM